MYLLREKRDTDEDTVDIYTIMTTFHPPNSTIFNVHNIRYRIRLYRVGIELQSVYLYCTVVIITRYKRYILCTRTYIDEAPCSVISSYTIKVLGVRTGTKKCALDFYCIFNTGTSRAHHVS